jgi:hypothetical protein
MPLIEYALTLAFIVALSLAWRKLCASLNKQEFTHYVDPGHARAQSPYAPLRMAHPTRPAEHADAEAVPRPNLEHQRWS